MKKMPLSDYPNTPRRFLLAGGVCLLLFALLLALLLCVDVSKVGDYDMPVGLSTINRGFSELIGYRDVLYTVTEVTGVILLLFPLLFALLGAVQLLRSRSLGGVDADLYCLAGLYAMMAVAYAVFEVFVVNYRPMYAPNAPIEASFPSSHTLLALCIGASAIRETAIRLSRHPLVRRILTALLVVLTLVTILGRACSGVHWLTDILGSVLLGSALICFFEAALARFAHPFPSQTKTEEPS